MLFRSVFEWLVDYYDDPTTIVLDEFDRIESDEERYKFADLLKHLGNQCIPLKLIITGIAENVVELIGAHPSAARQIDSIEIPRLSFDDRWRIIREPLQALGVEISRDLEIRIALISDGFPYYVHLLTEKLLWVMFDEAEEVRKVSEAHYAAALAEAIEMCLPEYRRPYDAVVTKNPDYEEALWATADTEFLTRNIEDMYLSYQSIVRQRRTEAIDQKEFGSRIKNLTKVSYGPILKRMQPGSPYFDYCERMQRGFVRLQAESHGVRLYTTHLNEPKPVTAQATSSRLGYHGSSVPAGVSLSGDRKQGQSTQSDSLFGDEFG